MRLPHSQSQRNSIMQTPVLLLAAVHAALALLSFRERLWADVPEAQLSRGLIGCLVLDGLRSGDK